jgi:hypothetical protein
MPLHWTIDSRLRTFVATCDGTVDLAEVNVMLDAVVGANGLGYRKLFDGMNGNTQMSALDMLSIGVRIRALQDGYRKHGPLAIVVQSSSAAGKSSLMDAVLAFMPEEERIKYSAMTGQSLFYMGETNLKHKILAIAEEEGASRASYALKLLQSEGELTIASTGKDPNTGRMDRCRP